MFFPGSKNELIRYVFCVAALLAAALVVAVRLVLLHFNLLELEVKQPRYDYRDKPMAVRGDIYSADGQLLAKTHVLWEYRLDPKAALVDPHHPKQRISSEGRMKKMRLVSENLGIPLPRVMDAYAKLNKRNQFLARNASSEVHAVLALRTNYLHELKINLVQERCYPQSNLLSHVLGYVDIVGCAGIEQRYQRVLKDVRGVVEGTKNALGVEDPSRREISVKALGGQDVHLTINKSLQYEMEKCLREGLAEHKAERAWAVMLSVKTGAVLAMAAQPDFNPACFQNFPSNDLVNPVVTHCYEPGSVMKTITAAACLNEGLVTPDTMINTARNDPNYYHLPGDAGHVWEETMSVRDALVHSSNIVFGKLGVNLGSKKLWSYLKAFGFRQYTEIDLPREQRGLLRDPTVKGKDWDAETRSRIPIGQGLAVTAIQLASAYATIANDGRRMRPYIMDHIVRDGTNVVLKTEPLCVEQAIRPEVARQLREMMLGVAKKGGTARRAAVTGYSVAGKTGTAQLASPKGYSMTEFDASFIGIIPASRPEVVILVTFHKPFFCRSRETSEAVGVPIFNHQGGICAAPVFSRIAEKAMRYLMVEPDIPEEVIDALDE